MARVVTPFVLNAEQIFRVVDREIGTRYSEDGTFYTTKYNEFVPFYAPFLMSSFTMTRGDQRLFVYPKYHPDSRYTGNTRRYNNLWNSFINPTDPQILTGQNILAVKGMFAKMINYPLSRDFNPLMMLAIRAKDLFYTKLYPSSPPSVFKGKMVMLVNHNLLEDIELRKFHDRVAKATFDELGKLDADIIYTNNMDKYCFNKSPGTRFQFSTLQEMRDYTRGLNHIIHGTREEQREASHRLLDIPF